VVFALPEGKMTKFKSIVVCTILATIFSQPVVSLAQTAAQHREAQREQDAHDKRHHNTAKVVGGSAAGGAVVGGLMGGGKGALIGGAVGAGGGVVADKVRKHNGVKKRERRENRQYQENPR
jgi:outer membrane lipoprotein SlyB